MISLACLRLPKCISHRLELKWPVSKSIHRGFCCYTVMSSFIHCLLTPRRSWTCAVWPVTMSSLPGTNCLTTWRQQDTLQPWHTVAVHPPRSRARRRRGRIDDGGYKRGQRLNTSHWAVEMDYCLTIYYRRPLMVLKAWICLFFNVKDCLKRSWRLSDCCF